MTRLTACPPDEQLQLFLFGLTPDEADQPLEEHVLYCEKCCATARSLTDTPDTFVNLMREQATMPSIENSHDTALYDKLDRIVFEQSTAAFRVKESTDDNIDFLRDPEAPDELGRFGKYRILNQIGAGGMGIVFRAEEIQLKRVVALKVMRPYLADSMNARERFLREAQAVAAIEHDHIVAIHQVGEDRNLPFLAMPFLQGQSLEDMLGRDNRLSESEAIRIGREIAEGLAAAHDRGLIHRDIKPRNIWIESRPNGSPRVKILDFGLAGPSEGDSQLTQTGAVAGTPGYMSPEQAQGETVDHRCDLFSLGCVLYRMTTGKAPFEGSNVTAKLIAVVNDTLPAPHSVNAEIGTELSDLIVRLLFKAPKKRPPTAAEVVGNLIDIAQNSKPQVPNTRKAKSTEQRTSRRLFAAAIGLAVAVWIAWLFGGTIVRFAMNEAELLVDVNDPNIEVLVKRDGIKVGERTTERAFWLTPTNGEIEVYEKDGIHLLTKKFSLTRGGRTTVTVTVSEIAASRKKAAATVVPSLAIGPYDETQATKLQYEWAVYYGVSAKKTNSIGMRFRLIPPGEFWCGAKPTEFGEVSALCPWTKHFLERLKSETPQRRVKITAPFYIGIHEVTRSDFEQFVRDTQYQTDAEKANFSGWRVDLKKKTLIQHPQHSWRYMGFDQTAQHPVANVTWNDATAFCKWLSEKENQRYRLPTEAEWEYACRAGTQSRYPSGDDTDQLNLFANVADQSLEKVWQPVHVEGRTVFIAGDDGFPFTAPVGSFKPNAFGLYDMIGNVKELCRDCWSKDYFIQGVLVDPTGPKVGEAHVVRGGSWRTSDVRCRAATRHDALPNENQVAMGFRVVCEIDEPPKSVERSVSEWVLRIGGAVEPHGGDKITKIEGLPKGNFLLQWVYLDGVGISDDDLNRLVRLKSLQGLRVGGNPITDDGLAVIGKISSLFHLFIGRTKITNAGLISLKHLKELEMLSIGNAGISDDGARAISALKRLKWLSLDGTKITDDGLMHLAALPSLNTIRARNTAVTAEGVRQFSEESKCKVER